MNHKFIRKMSVEFSIAEIQIEAVLKLLGEGGTVPFIARYRKEATGLLDEVAVAAIRDRTKQLEELEARREAILASLEERELLTDKLREKIEAAETMSKLEDIYLPYRPKRRTRAIIAREKRLEPLAEMIFMQNEIDPETEAEKYIDSEKGVENVEDALKGARDIIAEWINEHEDSRQSMRKLFMSEALLSSKVLPGKEEKAIKFKDYFDVSEPATQIKSHRLLAVFRGEREFFLMVKIRPEEDQAVDCLKEIFIKAENLASEQVELAARDCYKRLLEPSMETETRVELKRLADIEAVNVFTKNARELLMAPPLGSKRVMAIDPGFRTGCKISVLDERGKLLHHTAIYPHTGERNADDAAATVVNLCKTYKVKVIAVGNGTAGRETEVFLKKLELPKSCSTVLVNESGASIYSASEVAREEFPDLDLTVRGAVSIGRRLMDPLAELVKIDPKSIGVGQYQHDVDQNLLHKNLDDTVISCVNNVGVELNTASKQLLSYVSGIGHKLAQNIVDHREETGSFSSRKELKKVKGLGAKAFEQAAGFLRIHGAKNPLDSSAVHPESYHIVKKMAEDCSVPLDKIISNKEMLSTVKLEDYITDKTGLPTLLDIIDELAKPGRDPRDKFEIFAYKDGVEKIDDLKPGMQVPGIITNVTNFGAFVDIGVHQDGLVHISQLANKFIKDPNDFVKVSQKVMVTVVDVDTARNRIQLSMRNKAISKG